MSDFEDMTLDQMSELLSRDAKTTRDMKGLLELHQRKYADITNPFYYDREETVEAMKVEHLPKLEAVELHVSGMADACNRNGWTIFEATKGRAEPALDAVERHREAVEAPVIRDECEKLSLEDLEGKIRYAIQTGDKSKQANYLRYARMRMGAGSTFVDGKEGPTDDQKSKSSIQALLYNIAERLQDTRFVKVHKQALDLMTLSSDLKFKAKERAEKKQRYRFQSDGDVAW